MINIPFFLIATAILAYMLLTLLFLLGLCRAAARGNRVAEEAKTLINYQIGTHLTVIPEQIESATL